MSRRSRTPFLVVAAVVLVAALGAGAYFFFLGGDQPPPVQLSGTDEQTPTEAPASIEGDWLVIAGDADNPTFVGYRVNETFLGLNRPAEAVGRTATVEGSLTISGTTIEAATFTADLTDLRSDESRRDNVLRGRGLEIDQFPTAVFELTQPIDVGGIPEAGTPTAASAVGNLTLHGVTREVSIPLEAVLIGGDSPRIEVVGNLAIDMADYEIEPPSVGGFVSVEDAGMLELHLFLERS
jgi:polyisoprenoid-binding protein YceI